MRIMVNTELCNGCPVEPCMALQNPRHEDGWLICQRGNHKPPQKRLKILHIFFDLSNIGVFRVFYFNIPHLYLFSGCPTFSCRIFVGFVGQFCRIALIGSFFSTFCRIALIYGIFVLQILQKSYNHPTFTENTNTLIIQ